MKKILLLLALLLSANAFALPPSECKKLAAFQANQQSKLSLSRYGLGLISAQQLVSEQKAQRQSMLETWKKCEVPDAQA